MYSVLYNRKEVCRLPLEELHALKQIAGFWGLSWEDESNQLFGRFSNYRIRIIGLNQKEFNRLNHLLMHTSVTLSKNTQREDLILSIFREENQHTVTVESNGNIYNYRQKRGPYSNTKDWIYKGFQSGYLYEDVRVYWDPNQCEDITEWLTYLILQSNINESMALTESISTNLYESLLKKVLSRINKTLSSYQLQPSWPDKPSFSESSEQKEADPINPFKPNLSTPPTKFDPFKNKNKRRDTKVINPFFKK